MPVTMRDVRALDEHLNMAGKIANDQEELGQRPDAEPATRKLAREASDAAETLRKTLLRQKKYLESGAEEIAV
jgi:hypothetical protein